MDVDFGWAGRFNRKEGRTCLSLSWNRGTFGSASLSKRFFVMQILAGFPTGERLCRYR
jgi:hypothetical protein